MCNPVHFPSSASYTVRLYDLQRRRQMLLDEIAHHKSLLNAILAFVFPWYCQQKILEIRFARKQLAQLIMTMTELHEQQVAVLFLENLQEELAKCSPSQILGLDD